MATALRPDVVLMDINMPGMDGITATEKLAAEVPTAAVIMMSVQGEADYLRRSMLAGRARVPRQAVQLGRADRVDPPGLDRARRTSRAATPRSSPRPRPGSDGTGEPAIGRRGLQPEGRRRPDDHLGQRRRRGRPDRQEGRLVDASFQFGDVGVLLNLNPRNKSIADLAAELQAGENYDIARRVHVTHSTGVRVLLAPPTPEQAELVNPAAVKTRARSCSGTSSSWSSSTARRASTSRPSPSSTKRT